MAEKLTDLKELEQLQMAANGLMADGPAQQNVLASATSSYVDPSAITQSYYTSPSTAKNYESGRPVYSESDAVKDAAAALAEKEAGKPGEYESGYATQIQELIDSLLNREKFSYDFSADPMYQQYAEKYQQMGKTAMRDTMGEAAALTGGYGNSYSQQVGQQTYQTYLQNLYDMIPELRDAAYQMYRTEGDDMRANLGMLQDQDSIDYGRYRDTVTDWQNELNYFYSKYSDMSAAEYNRYQNDAAAWEADRAYWYQKEQDKQQQANWEKEYALALAQANSSRSGGGGGKSGSGSSSSAAKTPTSYKEFAALTGNSSIMTESEFARHKNSNSSSVKGYGSYQDYLNAMWARYN